MIIAITQLSNQFQRLVTGGSTPMRITAADLTLGMFQAIPWQNLTFVDCEFRGSNVKLGKFKSEAQHPNFQRPADLNLSKDEYCLEVAIE